MNLSKCRLLTLTVTLFAPLTFGAPVAIPAAGGDVVYDVDDNGTLYRVHIYTNIGTAVFQAHESLEVEYLIVGGGGGGAGSQDNDFAAGGGAGGLREGAQSLLPAQYAVEVGRGGAGAAAASQSGSSGDASFALGIEAVGGGAGGRRWSVGHPGGSGGGGGNKRDGGYAVPGQGHAGGEGSSGGAGGGGAGGAGLLNAGGPGLASAITGSSELYAAGGGRGGTSGGSGIGGDGAMDDNGTTVPAQAGAPFTGSGGGGGADFSPAGGNGSSGIVVIRYAVNPDTPLPFLVADLETGSTGFTNSNEVELVGFAIPEEYDRYQITQSDDPSGIDPDGWLAAPTSRVAFDAPGEDAYVTLHAWFTNISASVALRQDQAAIVYTQTAPPAPAIRSALSRQTAGFAVCITGQMLDKTGASGGAFGERPIDVHRLDAVVVAGPEDVAPDDPRAMLPEAGSYEIALRVVNAAGNATLSAETCVVTVADAVDPPVGDRHVAFGNAFAEGPYDSWDTAAPDIQLAVDAAEDGDTIWIWPGRYIVTTNSPQPGVLTGLDSFNFTERGVVYIQNKRIQLRGAGASPLDVVVDGQDAYRGVSVHMSGGMDSHVVKLDNVTVTNARAYVRGSGVTFMQGGDVTNRIERCVIAGNHSGSGGAGLHINGGTSHRDTFYLVDSLVRDNHGSFGIYNNRLAFVVEGSEIADHPVRAVHYEAWTSASFRNTVFRGNRSGSGAAMFLDGSGVRLFENCLFYNNVTTTSSGGAVQLDDSRLTVTVRNCTFAGNLTEYASGTAGLQASAGDVNVVNTILYGNTNQVGDARNYGGSFVDIAHSCIDPIGDFTDAGNIDDDPRFVDPLGGNYRLSGGSPTINTGVYEDWMDDAVDLDGNPRIDPTYNEVDMGAHEFQFVGTTILVR